MFRRTALVATLCAAVLMSTAPAASAVDPNPAGVAAQVIADGARTLVSTLTSNLAGGIGAGGAGVG